MSALLYTTYALCAASLLFLVASMLSLRHIFGRDASAFVWMSSMLYPLSQLLFLGFQMWYTLMVCDIFFSLFLAAVAFGCSVVDVKMYRRLLRMGRESIEREELARLTEQIGLQRERVDELASELGQIDDDCRRLVASLDDVDAALESGDLDRAGALAGDVADSTPATGKRLCDNPIVDALLTGKGAMAADAGVVFDCAKVDAPSDLPFTPAQLCAIFANMCDNAIHAAAAVPEGGERRVSVETRCAKGGLFVITVSNTFDKAAKARLAAERKAQEKKGLAIPRHGLGLGILSHMATAMGGGFEHYAVPGDGGDIGVWRAIMTLPLDQGGAGQSAAS